MAYFGLALMGVGAVLITEGLDTGLRGASAVPWDFQAEQLGIVTVGAGLICLTLGAIVLITG